MRSPYWPPFGSVTSATGSVSWGTELMLIEWKPRTRLAMSRTDHDWSKVMSPFTELMRSRSLMGLPSPCVAAADASTLRNS